MDALHLRHSWIIYAFVKGEGYCFAYAKRFYPLQICGYGN